MRCMRLAEEIVLARSAMSFGGPKNAELIAPCRPQLRDRMLTKSSKTYRLCTPAPMSAFR